MHHTRAGHWFVHCVDTGNGRWICADVLRLAKWIFAKAEGIASIARIQGSRRGPATDTLEAPTTPKMSLLDTINAENNGIIDTMREWIGDGWEYPGEPSPAMIAAMMLGEAKGTDEMIAQGIDKDSSPEYPAMLRELAYQILDHYHPRPTISIP